MGLDFKFTKKKEPLLFKVSIPLPLSQCQRYKKIAYELDSRGFSLHDITRERIDLLLNEVELELAKSS